MTSSGEDIVARSSYGARSLSDHIAEEKEISSYASQAPTIKSVLMSMEKKEEKIPPSQFAEQNAS